jgi:nucleoside-diphosphate-sugar epimerase
MKILITGVSGFIGKNCLELFPENFEIIGIYNSSTTIKNFVIENQLNNVSLYQCDLTDELQAKELFLKIGGEFDNCIYLSSNVNIPLSISNPSFDLTVNCISLINILKYATFDKFIYMSSAGVYDGLDGNVDIESKLDPINPYCISKLAAEQYVKYFRSINKIKNYYILRLGGAFGNYSKNKFITKLVVDVYLKDKKNISVYGDGFNIIKTMYVKDTVFSLLACLVSENKDISCNLGQHSMPVKELVYEVAKIFGKKISINYIPLDKRQKYIYFEEKNDFNAIFNYNFIYTLERGIKEFGENLLKIKTF